MNLRRFKLGEEAKLFQVFLSAVHELASSDYSPLQLDAWAPKDLDPKLWAKRIQNMQPWVVELDGSIVGYADLQSDGYIDHFFVSADHIRQGVGSLLMLHIFQEAKQLGVRTLYANVSKTAEPFFRHHGFFVVSRESPVRNGVVLENALMQKVLKCE